MDNWLVQQVYSSPFFQLPIFYLVGNKIDIDSFRTVDAHMHMEFVETFNIDGDMYTSSRTGDSVLFMFRYSSLYFLFPGHSSCAAAKYLGVQLSKVDQEADIIITKVYPPPPSQNNKF